MTKIVYPCGCSQGPDRDAISPVLGCPIHGLTPPDDEPEQEEE